MEESTAETEAGRHQLDDGQQRGEYFSDRKTAARDRLSRPGSHVSNQAEKSAVPLGRCIAERLSQRWVKREPDLSVPGEIIRRVCDFP